MKMPEPLHLDVNLQDHAVTLRFADTAGLVGFIKWLDAADLSADPSRSSTEPLVAST